jgi:hypothetical protein
MFRRKKMQARKVAKPVETQVRAPQDGTARPHALGVLSDGRAPHNPLPLSGQQLVLKGAGDQRTATELVAAAGDSMPMLAEAMTKIAERFELSVRSADALNRSLAAFSEKVVNGLMGELQHLRYNVGDRLTQTSGNLQIYVEKLDRVLWGALRAQGMSDEAIRRFREENGMQPEAPSGEELIAHLAELEWLRGSNRELIAQNQRLVAQLEGVHDFNPGRTAWVYQPECRCLVCREETARLAAMHAEVTRVP